MFYIILIQRATSGKGVQAEFYLDVAGVDLANSVTAALKNATNGTTFGVFEVEPSAFSATHRVVGKLMLKKLRPAIISCLTFLRARWKGDAQMREIWVGESIVRAPGKDTSPLQFHSPEEQSENQMNINQDKIGNINAQTNPLTRIR